MGAWGAALFADDDALIFGTDIPAYLADAQTDAGATDLAGEGLRCEPRPAGETTAFWLALASIQWRIGHLDPRVNRSA